VTASAPSVSPAGGRLLRVLDAAKAACLDLYRVFNGLPRVWAAALAINVGLSIPGLLMDGSTRNGVGVWIVSALTAVASAFFLTPYRIAVHRLIILDEIAPSYILRSGEPRFKKILPLVAHFMGRHNGACSPALAAVRISAAHPRSHGCQRPPRSDLCRPRSDLYRNRRDYFHRFLGNCTAFDLVSRHRGGRGRRQLEERDGRYQRLRLADLFDPRADELAVGAGGHWGWARARTRNGGRSHDRRRGRHCFQHSVCRRRFATLPAARLSCEPITGGVSARARGTPGSPAGCTRHSNGPSGPAPSQLAPQISFSQGAE
jgi:hypothetical protein